MRALPPPPAAVASAPIAVAKKEIETPKVDAPKKDVETPKKEIELKKDDAKDEETVVAVTPSKLSDAERKRFQDKVRFVFLAFVSFHNCNRLEKDWRQKQRKSRRQQPKLQTR